MPLGLAPGELLVSSRTADVESYQQYLRAKALVRNRGARNAIPDAIKMLEELVVHDPSYAPAWGLLAVAYPYFTLLGRLPASASASSESRAQFIQATMAKSEMAARESIRLDSHSAVGYSALAQFQIYRGNFSAGEDFFKQALALDPDDAETLDLFSNRLAASGRLKEAFDIRQKLQTLEPFAPTYNYITAMITLLRGDRQAAIATLETLPAGGPRNTTLAWAYAAEGRYGEAADLLLAVKGRNQGNPQFEEQAARLLRSAPTKVKAPQALPEFLGPLNFVYAYVGAPERVLELPEFLNKQHSRVVAGFRYLWAPEYAPLRKTERFKAIMRNAGLVDYWRQRGWADLCRPVGIDDFVCD